MISLDILRSFDDANYYDKLIVRGRNINYTRENAYQLLSYNH